MDDRKTTSEMDFLIRHVLRNGAHLMSDLDKDRLRQLQKEKVTVPHLFLSMGSTSLQLGATTIKNAIIDYLKENNIEARIETTGDLGFQNYEPVMHIQMPGKCRVAFKNVGPGNLAYILAGVMNNYLPEEHVLCQFTTGNLEPWDNIISHNELGIFSYQRKLVSRNCGMINPESLEAYIAGGGFKAFARTISRHTFSEVCDIIERSGLRGRGGAGYNTGKKWKSALNRPGTQKYLICNADESDPGSFIERHLIEGDPFRLVEGIAISAYAIGAKKAFIFIRNRNNLAVRRLENAIEQTKKHGLTGFNIFDSGFNLDITLVKGGGAMVCGEESAIIRSIEGKRPMPRPRPPYPAENGLYGKPTIVNNLETLMNVPDIMLHGAGWFRSIGTENNYGTKLTGVTGRNQLKAVAEVPLGMPLQDIITHIGMGVYHEEELKGVHIGGASGGMIPSAHLNMPFSFEAIKEKGGLMGNGMITVLSEKNCIVDFAKYMMELIRRESCGKCIPCREGSKRMFEILDGITRRPFRESGHHTLERFKGVMQLENLSEVIRDTSLCGLGKTAPNSIRTSLNYFREEYEDHIFDRECKAGVCKDLRRYGIDVDKCTGCGACARKCPENAIVGTKNQPFFIVEEKCTGCGKCFDSCKFNAVVPV